ncbi:MAG: hypothetical protein IPK07_25175 [Deltaproteobacteria bacterium]|nr:hypothetical protein [Deltaproteobacteria bacterium]
MTNAAILIVLVVLSLATIATAFLQPSVWFQRRRTHQSRKGCTMSLFKKKLDVVQIGTALLAFAQEPDPGSPASRSASLSASSPRRIANEMLFLRIFAVDFGVAMAVDGPKKGQILDIFYEHVRRIGALLGLPPSSRRTSAPDHSRTVAVRDTGGGGAMLQAIGSTFVTSCDGACDDSLSAAMDAGMTFGMVQRSVKDFLGSIRIA